MAIVYKYTIIYLTLVIHKTTSIHFNRNLCLETVARFITQPDRCHQFSLSTAKDILQDVTTCPYKCNFRIDNLDCCINSLQRTDLTIGNEQKILWFCPISIYNRNSFINCSSWNTWRYILQDHSNVCFNHDAQCVRINNFCICQCMIGYTLVNGNCFKNMVEVGGMCKFKWQCRGAEFANDCNCGLCSCSSGKIQIDRKCYPDNVPVGGFCSLDKQCTGSNNSGICEHGRCTCANGFTVIDLECEKRNLKLNDSCELTEQCIQPFSVCFEGKCKCMNGFSAFETDTCLNDTVPVGGFCSLDKQCTGSNNSGICEHGRCTCAKGFTFIDLACKKNDPNRLRSSKFQQQDISTGITFGTLFGGFILGVIVTAVVTTLMYRRIQFRTSKREELDVMVAENRAYGDAGVFESGAQISYRNDKKQKMATLVIHSFPKKTPGYILSGKQENERTEDVYNHLHEHTEPDGDTYMYDHACAAPNPSTDLPDYSNFRDITFDQPTSSTIDDGDYSTLGK